MRFLTASLAIVIAGLVAACTQTEKKPVDTITQVSTIDALLAGVYDGSISCGELKTAGSLGIGTFDGLDGEMILLNGVVYKVDVKGQVHVIEDREMSPFASVCLFEPAIFLELEKGADYAFSKEKMDQELGNENAMFAFHIRGHFSSMKTRSVPAQTKPYKALAEVVKNQAVFQMQDVEGDIVGFRLPPYIKGVNVPGYHLHFLSKDRKQGGHILDFTVDHATVAVDKLARLLLVLNDEAIKDVDLSKDRSKELHSVEMDK